MIRGAFDQSVKFKQAVTSTDDYGGNPVSGTPTELTRGWARVRFGLAQEKREAAQEGASQTATFELVPTAALLAVPMTALIEFDGSDWDVTEKAPLDRNLIRFTATRSN